jgi:hypothetical protein
MAHVITWFSRYRRPLLAVAGAALVLAGTVGAAAAFVDGSAGRGSILAVAPATDDPLDSFQLDAPKPADARTALCETYQSTLAARLGVSTDRLDSAMRDAAKAAIDRAVAGGLIPAERAAKLRARIDAADGPVCRTLPAVPKPGTPGEQARKSVLDPKALLAVAAQALGTGPDALLAEIRGLAPGQDMRTLAANHRVPYETLSAALRKAAQGQVDAAVQAGRITTAQGEKVMVVFSRGLERGRFLPRGFRGLGQEV